MMPLTYDLSLNPKGGIRVRSYVAPKTKEYERYKMKQSKLFERISFLSHSFNGDDNGKSDKKR